MKHVVIKVADVQAYLTPEEQGYLSHLLQKIQIGRANAGKPTNTMVALNLSDPYARAALDQYILVAETSPDFEHNQQVRDVCTFMRSALLSSRMSTKERLPDA